MRLVLLPLGLLAVLGAVGLARGSESAPAPPAPEVELVEIGRFEQPVHVASPPGDERLFVVEKKGRIWILERRRRLARPFLDITRRVSSGDMEEGLLSIAFPPDYSTSGLFYIDYTDLRHRTVVEEHRRSSDPDIADEESARQVLRIDNPTTRHHGGLVQFGPDGYLYVSQGDGGIFHDLEFPSLTLDTLHGKVLRIDPRRQGKRPYGIPPDNPYVDRPGRDEIWVYGLRNPWRFGFDEPTGALVIGDVGQNRFEEINIAREAGLNFGWPCLEGNEPFNPVAPERPGLCEGLTPPALQLVRSQAASVEPKGLAPTVTRGRPRARVEFTPGGGACSIVPGFTVSDAALLPSLTGRFLYGDFCDPPLRSFRIEDGRAVDDRPLGVNVLVLSSFGVDAAGRLYATALTGQVYRLEAP